MQVTFRRSLLATFLCCWLPPVAALAQGYPSKPVVMLVPFAAGGPTDVVGRQIGEHMGRTLGRPFVIETAAGTGGTFAAERLAKAIPDGYTILIHHNGLPTAPALYSNLRYDTRAAFEPIGLINTGPMIVVAKNVTGAKSLKELFDQWSASEGKITLGHAGVGSTSYMCGLQINNVLKKKFTFVTYRGTAPAISDIVAGQIDGMCDLSTSALPQILVGTVKAYGVTSAERLPSIKDVLTTKEAGYNGLDMTIYNALYAPKGTPKDVIAKLSDALQKALNDPAIQEKFTAAGTSTFPADQRSPEAHRKFFLEQIESQAAVFSSAGVVPGKTDAPAATLPAPTAAAPAGFPNKAITLVVPFAAGGPTDAIARIIGEHLGRSLGQSLVVENQVGGGGTVAAERVATANADGYTLQVTHVALAAAPALYRDLRYDTKTAFTAIGLINNGPMMILSKKALAFANAKELIAHLKANASKVSLAHAGVGSGAYLCGLQLEKVVGTKLTFVPYRGTGPAMNDLVGGQIDAMCDQSTNAIPQIAAGNIKAYAVTGGFRLPGAPDVPTANEAGIPELDMTIWHALYGPKGLPADVVAKLNTALTKALQDKDVASKFAAVGTQTFPESEWTPEAHVKRFQASINSYIELFKSVGASADTVK